MHKYLVTALLLLFGVQTATAQTISSVGSADVTKGKTVVEGRIGYSLDDSNSQDERLRTRLHVDHGFTDWYAGRLIIEGDNRKGEDFDYEGITFENRFDLYDAAEIGFDFGMRAAYSLKSGDNKPDSITIGFYEVIPHEAWEIRLNQFLSHEIGPEATSGLNAAMRAQATYAYTDNHRAGLETFNSFGNLRDQSGFNTQGHVIGPVFKGKLGQGYSYETGYLKGLTDSSADHNFKLFIAKSF